MNVNSEQRPKVAILSSYHGERAAHFQEAFRLFQDAGSEIIHQHTARLKNPVDDISVFVLREGDQPGIRNHELQIKELQNMLNLRADGSEEMRQMLHLRDTRRGRGFAYVVAEDNKVGMHTAAEIVWVAGHRIPVVSSKEITGFRNIPNYMQDVIRKSVITTLPFEDINPNGVARITEQLKDAELPSYTDEERKLQFRVVRNAVREQKYSSRMRHVLVASESLIKRAAVHEALRELYPEDHVLIDSVAARAPNVPEQPFQEQGVIGAQGRLLDALDRTQGYQYSGGVFSIESALIAVRADQFDPNAWMGPEKWASNDQITRDPEGVLYADIAVIALQNENGQNQLHYSKPVRVPSNIAIEARSRGEDTLYAHVLQERYPWIDLADPQRLLTRNRYPRSAQIKDVLLAAHRF